MVVAKFSLQTGAVIIFVTLLFFTVVGLVTLNIVKKIRVRIGRTDAVNC